MTSKKREKLGMPYPERPWTTRPSVHARGCSKQLDEYCFLFELLDLRWAEYAKKNDLDMSTASPPDHLFADVRQNILRQKVCGSMTLLSRSLPYWYARDRTAIPEECLIQQGWPDGFSVTDLSSRIEGWPAELRPKPRKRAASADDATGGRKQQFRRSYHGAALVDLAGNGYALPDLCQMGYSLLLASESDLFQNLPPEAIETLLEIDGPSLELDPGSSLQERRALARRLGEVDNEDPQDAFAEEDEGFLQGLDLALGLGGEDGELDDVGLESD